MITWLSKLRIRLFQTVEGRLLGELIIVVKRVVTKKAAVIALSEIQDLALTLVSSVGNLVIFNINVHKINHLKFLEGRLNNKWFLNPVSHSLLHKPASNLRLLLRFFNHEGLGAKEKIIDLREEHSQSLELNLWGKLAMLL
ncbi:hypothetical protein ACFX11_038341 [Malus domestica]